MDWYDMMAERESAWEEHQREQSRQKARERARIAHGLPPTDTPSAPRAAQPAKRTLTFARVWKELKPIFEAQLDRLVNHQDALENQREVIRALQARVAELEKKFEDAA